MQRATVVQFHYVVDHPKVGKQLIWKKLPICKSFKDKDIYSFYCATIAYHVGLIALLRWPPGPANV